MKTITNFNYNQPKANGSIAFGEKKVQSGKNDGVVKVTARVFNIDRDAVLVNVEAGGEKTTHILQMTNEKATRWFAKWIASKIKQVRG